jgi:hypothetical protein
MRVCIFCGEQASSKEDAWPLWLMRLLPSNGQIEAERGGNPLAMWRPGTSKLAIRCVCISCNSGWMSRLENCVKPIVLGLMDDTLKIIDSSAQSTLAQWAVKNAMVHENLYPDRPRFYRDDERHQLRMDTSIPHRTSIWLAKCVEHQGAFCFAQDLHGPLPQERGECHTYATTLAFGSLALQVVTSHLPASVHLAARITTDLNPGPWSDVAIRIWPDIVEHRKWPPKVGLNGISGLDEFGKRFRVYSDGLN